MNAFFSANSIPLLALHGWGMNASVWNSVESYLPDGMPLIGVDLPGYGGNEVLLGMTIESTVHWLARQFNGKCHLLGWSMGGLVAQAFCHHYPDRVKSITLVASTPCFIQHPGWECALDASVLEQFSEQLKENQKATIRRFIALQFMGESGTAKVQKQLRESVMSQALALETLDLGLTWLMQCDYRKQLETLPAQHWILGGLDRLIPRSLGLEITRRVPHAKVTYFDDCGHAPFLTQPERFTEKLLEFIPH